MHFVCRRAAVAADQTATSATARSSAGSTTGTQARTASNCTRSSACPPRALRDLKEAEVPTQAATELVAAALFHINVALADMSLRAQLIGRIKTARYLRRVLTDVPYGQSSSLRHVGGGTRRRGSGGPPGRPRPPRGHHRPRTRQQPAHHQGHPGRQRAGQGLGVQRDLWETQLARSSICNRLAVADDGRRSTSASARAGPCSRQCSCTVPMGPWPTWFVSGAPSRGYQARLARARSDPPLSRRSQ